MDIVSINSIDDSIKEQLVNLLIDGVESKAAIGFVYPLSREKAIEFWDKVNQELKVGTKILLVSKIEGSIVGTIQCSWTNTYSNAKHRCEIQKLIVHTTHRKKGIAKLLLKEIEKYSLSIGKELLILDTRSGDPVTYNLYKSIGYIEVGSIPYFASESNVGEYSGTTIFYKLIGNMSTKN
ncbi:hypothetical protein RB653_007996 [Dictyostelium firmibasis]|uniref:N-acetyltransferase domain-containing protein n=1 Tax=Dictyostelium firmibasis TaxID=79012 RepID=A0AAN7YQS0_9MYCE